MPKQRQRGLINVVRAMPSAAVDEVVKAARARGFHIDANAVHKIQSYLRARGEVGGGKPKRPTEHETAFVGAPALKVATKPAPANRDETLFMALAIRFGRDRSAELLERAEAHALRVVAAV